jgi:uncharacterized protein (TIGR03663 family)
MPEAKTPEEREAPQEPIAFLDRRLDLTQVEPQVWIFGLLLVAAALLRFWDLGSRAFHHDEAIHALNAWRFLTGEAAYQYQPAFHGPFLYQLTALFYFLFGASDALARAPEALFGLLLVALCYPMRRWLGRWAWVIAVALFAFSPAFTYFSRFARQDVFVAALTLGMVYFIFRYLEERRPRDLILAAAALALAFASHEQTWIIAFVLFSFLGLAYLLDWQGRRLRTEGRIVAGTLVLLSLLVELRLAALGIFPLLQALTIALLVLALGYLALSLFWPRLFPQDSSPVQRAWLILAKNPRTLLTAVGVFGLIVGLLFTNFLTYPRGFVDGLYRGLEYWAGQQNVQRGDQPWFYYLMLLVLYEPIVWLAGLAGIGVVLSWAGRKRKRAKDQPAAGPTAQPQALFPLFLVYWAVFSLFIYSWAGEKMPWLLLQVALPLVLLAGLALDRLVAWVSWRTFWRSMDWIAAPLFLLLALALRGLVALFRGEVPHPLANQYLQLQEGVLILVAIGLIALLVWRIYVAEGRHLGQSFALLGLTLLAVYTIHSTFLLSFYNGDAAVEPLVYSQTAPDVPLIVREIERMGIDQTRKERTLTDPTGGHGLKIAIDTSRDVGLAQPFDWYLRDFARAGSLSYFDGSTERPPDSDILLVVAENEPQLRPFLQGQYTSMRLKLRWWFPEAETYKRWTAFTGGTTKQGQSTMPWLLPSTYSREGAISLWNYLLYRQIPESFTYTVQDGDALPGLAAQFGVATETLISLNGLQPPYTLAPGQPLKVPYTVGSQDFYFYVRSELLPAGGTTGATDPYIEKLTSRTAVRVIGSAGNGPGQLSYPRAIALDQAGNLYVADSGNNRVVRFDTAGQSSAWGGFCDLSTGQGCIDPDAAGPQPLGAGQFYEPWGIAVDAQGRVYVADTWNHRIQAFDANGRFLGQWGETVLVDADSDPRGRAGAPYGFYGPRGLAVDSQGHVYVTDTGNERVLVYDIAQETDGTVTAAYWYQWGTMGPAEGQFLEPVGVAVDPAGRVYVADTLNGRIQVFAPGSDGQVSPQPAVTWKVTGWDSPSRENKPFLAVSPGGQIYFPVPERNYVAATDGTGKILTVWGAAGTDLASFTMPVGVAVDAQGQVYVSDSGNGRILVFTVP